MSRIGKQIIIIPKGTEVNLSGVNLTIKGTKGTISRDFPGEVAINIENEKITLSPKKLGDKKVNALWGTYASHIKNMIFGVNNGYTRKLILEGVGFKSEVSGTNLNLSLGFSHPVKVIIPSGITVTADKNNISISGVDKELVGSFGAKVRSLKKPEPYKGKGFHYEDEVIRRKQGKKAA